jgi:hypothetical protein
VSRTHLRIELGDLKVAEADILPRLKLVLQEEKASEIAETVNGLKFFIPMFWNSLCGGSNAWAIDRDEIVLAREENAWGFRLAFSHLRALLLTLPALILGAAVLQHEHLLPGLYLLFPGLLILATVQCKLADIYMKTRLRTALCGPE